MGVVYEVFLESDQRIIAEVYYQQLDEMNVQLTKILPALVN